MTPAVLVKENATYVSREQSVAGWKRVEERREAHNPLLTLYVQPITVNQIANLLGDWSDKKFKVYRSDDHYWSLRWCSGEHDSAWLGPRGLCEFPPTGHPSFLPRSVDMQVGIICDCLCAVYLLMSFLWSSQLIHGVCTRPAGKRPNPCSGQKIKTRGKLIKNSVEDCDRKWDWCVYSRCVMFIIDE